MLTKRSTPDASAALEHVQGAQTLVLHRLARVPLEQRQVLERGGVEDDLGPALGEDLRAMPLGVADVGEDEVAVVEQGPAVERELDGVQGRLVAVEHDQLAGVEPVDLAAQLGADRAAGAGDQHPPAGEVVARSAAGRRRSGGGRAGRSIWTSRTSRDGDPVVEQVPTGGSTLNAAPAAGCASRISRISAASALATEKITVLAPVRRDGGREVVRGRRARGRRRCAGRRLSGSSSSSADRQVPAARVAEHGPQQPLAGVAEPEQQHGRRTTGRPAAWRGRGGAGR